MSHTYGDWGGKMINNDEETFSILRDDLEAIFDRIDELYKRAPKDFHDILFLSGVAQLETFISDLEMQLKETEKG